MRKKIAVLVRDRQAEALRMALGLTMGDDEVDVYIMDCRLASNDRKIAENLAMLSELGTRIVSNCPDLSFELMQNEVIARKLLHYDTVIPF